MKGLWSDPQWFSDVCFSLKRVNPMQHHLIKWTNTTLTRLMCWKKTPFLSLGEIFVRSWNTLQDPTYDNQVFPLLSNLCATSLSDPDHQQGKHPDCSLEFLLHQQTAPLPLDGSILKETCLQALIYANHNKAKADPSRQQSKTQRDYQRQHLLIRIMIKLIEK